MKVTYFTEFPYSDYVNSLIGDNYVDSFGVYAIREKTVSVYEDSLYLNLSEDIIKYLIYKEVREKLNIPKVDDKISFDVISRTYYDNDVIERLKTFEPKCEYFRVMKYIIDDITILEEYLKNNQSYMVLKKYREIIKKLNLEAIDPNITDEELSLELKLRYNIGADKITDYKYRVKRQLFKDIGYSPTFEIRKTNYSRVCSILQKYLYQKMLSYYYKTGYFYRQIDDNFDYFTLNKIAFITYAHDDDLNIKIGKYDLDDYEFWAKVFMPTFNSKNVTIQTFEGYENSFDGEIYYVPFNYMDEAFIKIINGPLYDNMTDSMEALELFNRIGFPEDAENRNKLLKNGNVFFKDPRLIDEIVVGKNKEYKTLKKLKNTPYGEERNEYIKRLIIKFKADETRKVNNMKNVQKQIENYSKNIGKRKGIKEYID